MGMMRKVHLNRWDVPLGWRDGSSSPAWEFDGLWQLSVPRKTPVVEARKLPADGMGARGETAMAASPLLHQLDSPVPPGLDSVLWEIRFPIGSCSLPGQRSQS